MSRFSDTTCGEENMSGIQRWIDRRIKEEFMASVSVLARKVLVVWIAVLGLASQTPFARGEVELLHTFGSSVAHEVAIVIPVNLSRLAGLLPAGYSVLPASALGFGGPYQGLVAIFNFQGINPSVDSRTDGKPSRASIDVVILVAEPLQAATAGVKIPGAFHTYTLAIYTDNREFAAGLRAGDMPVEFVRKLTYQRDMDDASGAGNVTVTVPSKDSPFKSVSTGFGYGLQAGALNAILWHEGRDGRVALHFHDVPFRQGNAISRVYTKPHSRWEALLADGGLGPCAPDPETGYSCVNAVAINLRYDKGDNGRLLLIDAD
jgi:hypothetical protein